ncbi:LZTR1 [Symbiodinium natans]|uniref:LZTR1 protein n=1 Tax=Symbiodinium natans TaxID=878477 RepID=A0A812KEY5_9DINO|nr:LZTR1 [Symbiodinium natans]
MQGLVDYEDSDEDAEPNASAEAVKPPDTETSEKVEAAAPPAFKASPPTSSPPSGPSSSPPEGWRPPASTAPSAPPQAEPPKAIRPRPASGPPPPSRDWSNPYILERLVQELGLQQYGSNFPKDVFDPERVAHHPSDLYDAPECERPPPPKRAKKAHERRSLAPASPGPPASPAPLGGSTDNLNGYLVT